MGVIRVLSANLFSGGARPAALTRVLEEYQPAIAAFQELAPEAAEAVSSHFEHGFLDPRADYSGLGIASHLPIAIERRSLPHRDAFVARTADFDLWSVHLANPVDAPPPIAARRAQVAALVEGISGDEPLVVMGDFNATPMWPAYRRITRHLEDGVAAWAAAVGRRPARTWAYRPGWPPMLRIDHAFVRNMKVTLASVVPIAGSDHRALIVDLEPSARDAL